MSDQPNPTAFDAFAPTYDDDFTQSALGRILRARVWQVFAKHFSEGQHLLELTCGTGEDAIWLAQHGFQVTATDGSAEMVRLTQKKVERHGLAERIITQQLALQQLDVLAGSRFDGAYSNFGGVNTIDGWSSLAHTLAWLIRPGGRVVLVPMGPLCPWEIGWYLLHGEVGTATRRFNQPASARIGDATIPIWYPSLRRLKRDFAPWFTLETAQGLGLWLPPSYLDRWVNRWPRLFAGLNQFEQVTGRWTRGWGDHYIAVFKRR